MTIILLIRHGENDPLKQGILVGNSPGIHLNERGYRQANKLAEALKERKITSIYSSPLERAVETAAPLAEVLDLKIIIRPLLTDTDVGTWTGRKINELKHLPAWKQVHEKPSGFQFPGGDSFAKLQQRLAREISSISDAHKNNEIVAVIFHADPIKLVIAHYLELPLDYFQRLRIDTASITELFLRKTSAELRALNLTAKI